MSKEINKFKSLKLQTHKALLEEDVTEMDKKKIKVLKKYRKINYPKIYTL